MSELGIAIVTPSFNQGGFLAATMDSVLNQNFGALQYVVMDGGSSDQSLDIIRERSGRLLNWQSAPDGGQYSSINKGLHFSDAEIMGWLNSDDLHLPWTLKVVSEIFSSLPQVQWLTTSYPLVFDVSGLPLYCNFIPYYSQLGILKGETMQGNNDGFLLSGIQQESTFWRRNLWEQVGGRLEKELDYAADFDLWMRFAKHADIYSVTVPLAGFRRHGDQKTSRDMNRYRSQAMESFKRHGKGFSNRRLRTFARQVLPQQLKSFAAKLGWLYPAKIVKKNRDSGEWVVQEILA
jgi:glycosyltransferase involved in cell wall biosynthesis